MVDLVLIFEVLALLVIGFAAGKVAHAFFSKLAKTLVGKTRTTLDDTILEYIEYPLELTSMFIVTYLATVTLNELSAIRPYVEKYSLALLIIIGAYLIAQVIGAVLRWYYVEGQKKAKVMDVTLLPFIRKLTTVVIVVLGISTALATLGFDVSSLFTITAVIGLVLGLASQETLANIFAGLALQLDRPYTYGDELKFTTGEVVTLKKIGIRSTKLLDANGNRVVISNSEFAKQRLTVIVNKDAPLKKQTK